MLTNYVYKLRPNITQSTKMGNWVDMLRSHYNWCLNDRLTQYAQQFIVGEYCDIRTASETCPLTCFVSKNGATGEPWKKSGDNKRRSAGMIQDAALPELKKARPWYASIDSTVLQQNVKRLDIAYKNFFEGRGFPKFKNRSNFTSFTYQMGIKVQKNKIYLPKLGWMRFHNSRSIPDGFTIKAVTIRKRQDGWYASIRIEDKAVPDHITRPITEVSKIIGCDLGITKLVHLSDGYQIENPKFATNKKTKRNLKIRQRKINRKVQGSNNRQKAAKKVGKIHKKIADKRQAYQWYVANKIVSRNVDAIAVENLNVSAMKKRCQPKIDEQTGRFLNNGQSRKKGLNRAISDASWNDLVLKIEYLAAKHGKVVIKINPKHTSQKCQNCGHIDSFNRDSEKFICTNCGFFAHADINAAKNIRDRALSIVLKDFEELEPKGSKRPKNRKETSQCLAGVPPVEATGVSTRSSEQTC
ncbi:MULTISPECIES: RNA-guided endonuclease InsQ/TnpB family protein [unclassified Calothrix]|uniref:RNA-guided endonuclease InsQ/TnpB family protein n=1 Tax=unclassified Calothrix TaxID=2619626 RepID=UPI0018EF7970|nr:MULTISPECIES: RNA-guided endonuclease TnpB family protein [unclassified Calothrix]